MTQRVPRDVEIRTARLVLRAPQKADYTQWSTGRTIDRRHLEPWEPRWAADALSRDDWSRRLKAWRSAWQDDRAYIFLMFERGAGALAGGISLTNVRRGPAQAASVGYWLLSHFQGQGLMQEGLTAIKHWSRSTLGLERLEAGTLPENQRSRSVLKRSGFVEEGQAAAYLEIYGQRRDHILFGLNLAELDR